MLSYSPFSRTIIVNTKPLTALVCSISVCNPPVWLHRQVISVLVEKIGASAQEQTFSGYMEKALCKRNK